MAQTDWSLSSTCDKTDRPALEAHAASGAA
jgi:hypothetical protein